MPIIKKQDNITTESSSPGLEVRTIADADLGTHALKIGEVTKQVFAAAPGWIIK